MYEPQVEAGPDQDEKGLSAATTLEPAPAPTSMRAPRFGRDLNLAVIGNCNVAALVDRNARVSWCCFPRMDADAIFCGLLDESNDPYEGCFSIELEDLAESRQTYRRNTAIVSTILTDRSGGSVEIVDFAPRLESNDRIVRPSMLLRRIVPVSGSCRVRIVIRPKSMLEPGEFERRVGSHHISYHGPSVSFRVLTDAPISYLAEEVPFVLDRPVDLILGVDEYLRESVPDTARTLYERTERYWFEWTRNLSIPFEWQDVVIRAAVTLKLCSFEDTGAIVAALTTSIPESAHSGRNWDYRFCWLRDSYFVVNALNHLGATDMMEAFIGFITNVAASSEGGVLKPVYGVVPAHDLDERIAPNVAGYRGMGPVRVGNKAGEQVQNDVYGSAILAATQMFFDERLSHPGDRALFERLERLGHLAERGAFVPDASLWEFRGRAEVHTYTSAMCWAACDRLAAIADRLGLSDRAAYWTDVCKPIRERILLEGWNDGTQSFVATLGGEGLDASLLLLSDIGFIAADDPRFVATVDAIGRTLRRGRHLMRYVRPDDFGEPETAFTVCTFWYVEALCAIGRLEEAREIFEAVLSHRNHVGLLSEDLDFETGELWGNFPQSYSMVGLVNSAMRLSKPWNNALQRAR